MASHERPPEDIENLSLAEMQHSLLEAGWVHPATSADDQSSPVFSREYPRTNELLQVGAWQNVISGVPDAIGARAPWLPQGIVIGKSVTETEITVEIHGHFDSKPQVTQVYLADEYLRTSGFESPEDDYLIDWMVMRGEPGQPRPDTPEFYMQSPRAMELRGICLSLIDSYAQVVLEGGAEDQVMADVVHLNTQLAALGIVSAMHSEARPVAFMDPATRAERIAGMLREALESGLGFSGNARRSLVDAATETEGDALTIDSKENPEAASQGLLLMSLASLKMRLGLGENGSGTI